MINNAIGQIVVIAGEKMKIVLSKAEPLKEKVFLFFELCSLDMKQKTAGTAFGHIWLYLNPLISIAVIWFVFHFGLRTSTSTSADSTYSLLMGLIAWQLILDTTVSGMGAVTEKPYLVKKIKFPLEFLPLIKVVNCFRIHIPFLVLIVLMSINSDHFSITRLLLFVFIAPFIFIFLTSIVLLLSTAVVFYRDLQGIVTMLMQLLFWGTPIIWSVPKNPEIIEAVELFNPFYFIV
ncbi:MAG: ABC transporter permease, partial [Pseudobdellovibrionaceae bacterium]